MILTRQFSISLWVSLIVLAALSGFAAVCPINQWSMGYLRQRLDGHSWRSALPEPPEDHPHAGIWLAEEALEQGNHHQAETLVRPLTERGDKYASFILGNILESSGEFSGAINAWQKSGNFHVLNQAAWKAREELRLQDALLAGKAAWELNPEQGTTSLIAFLKYSGDLGMSKELSNQMLAAYPNSKNRVYWLLNLADIELINKSWEEAESAYQQILVSQPNNIAAHIGLGKVYFERGDGLDKAITEFEQAIKQAPDQGEGYFAMGQALLQENKYDEADIWFKEAIRLDPNNKQWWLTRANAARSTGNINQALTIYQEMEHQFPSWAPIYYEMAWAYKLNHQFEQATLAVKSALALAKSPNSWYFFRAGQIYEEQGKMVEAMDAYAEALVLMPENHTFMDAMERLQNVEK